MPGLGAAAMKALASLHGTMEELRGQAGLPGVTAARAPLRPRAAGGRIPVAELLEAVLSQSGYLEALEADRTIEAQGRMENLEQLVEVGREFDAAAPEGEDTLDVFLQEIALVADADSRSDDEGLVTLMTLHNAKGLEYPIVFIAGCEDGVFPHSRAIDEGELEEERRLFYVGVTRAMRQPVSDLRAQARRVRRPDQRHAQPLPRRDPRGAARGAPEPARWGAGRAWGDPRRRSGSSVAARRAVRDAAPCAWAGAGAARGLGRRAFASARTWCTRRSARAWSQRSSLTG